MQRKTKNRLYIVILTFVMCSFGVYLILSNLNDNIVFFHPPSEIYKIKNTTRKVRIGGLVKKGSIKNLDEKTIIFTITDNIADMQIEFSGIVPALFREEQGIVAEGYLISPDRFRAKRLLAKHDENYTPPELSNLAK